MRGSLLLLVAGVVVLASCSELPPLQGGLCGNGVVDADEDCDTFAKGELACQPAGAANACRFVCAAGADGKRPPCPGGWGCGGDGVCRQPSGRYKATAAVVLASAAGVRMGDFDADGRQDVLTLGSADALGRREARVHFFEPDGASARTFVLPPPVIHPHVADFDGDGLDDLVAGVGQLDGVTAFLGSRELRLTPLAYPSFTLPVDSQIRVVPIDALPTKEGGANAGTEVLLFAEVASPQGTVRLLSATDLPDGQALLWLGDKGPNELAGDVVLGRLLEASPCPQLAFGFKGDNSALAYTPCLVKGGAQIYNVAPSFGALPEIPPAVIPLPGPLAGPIFVVDMDHDGHLDLLLGLKNEQMAVAYGDGALGFFAEPGGKGASHASLFGVPRGVDDKLGVPVAVGDLNGDGLPDFVLPRAIFVSFFATPDGVESKAGLSPGTADKCGIVGDKQVDCPLVVNLGAPWTDAAIADLNRDRFPDVVTGSSVAGVEFFGGTAYGILNRFALPTSGAAGRFSVGDYDGDTTLDVGFRELGIHGKAAGGSPVGDSLSVLFGRIGASPEAPVSMGRFERIEQVIAAQYFPKELKTASDLGVMSRAEEGKEQRVSLLGASGNRQMLAPFGFQVIVNDGSHTDPLAGAAIAFASGDLDGDGVRDVAALAFDKPERATEPPTVVRLWMALGQGEGKLADPRYSDPLPYAKGLSSDATDAEQAAFLQALLGAADLDGDGKVEVVHVAPDRDGQPTSLAAIARPLAGSDGAARLSLVSTAALPGYAAGDGQMMLADLDGDERPDLLVLTADAAPSATEGAAPISHVVILWNDGQGGFGAQNPLVLTPPSPSTSVRGVALLARNRGHDLAVATDAQTLLVRGQGRALAFADAPRLPRAEGVWAGDVTGDGVEDLALLEDGSLRLFAGVAERP